MANGHEQSLRNAAAKIAEYVGDVAEMKVETLYVRIGANGPVDFNDARPVAQMSISLDGDSKIVVPLRESEAGRFESTRSCLTFTSATSPRPSNTGRAS